MTRMPNCALQVVLAALLAAVCTNVAAAEFHTLEASRDGDMYRLSVDVYLDAPPNQVYRVLTDYNHLGRISGMVRQSRVLERLDAHTVLVYVESRVCVWFFCHTLRETQKVVESPPDSVTAEVIPAQSNVRFATSSWHLRPDGKGTRMRWQLSIEPEFWIPPLIGPALVKSELRTESAYTARGVEKLARERAHLPPQSAATHAPPAQTR